MEESSETADSDSASFGHVGNGFKAAAALLIFPVSLAAADMGNDALGGQQIVFGASFEAEGLEDG